MCSAWYTWVDLKFDAGSAGREMVKRRRRMYSAVASAGTDTHA